MQDPKGRYIELVGPPGSGKSTFLRQFCKSVPQAQKIERAATAMLKPAFPMHLRYLPANLAIKALKPHVRQDMIAHWFGQNATDIDRETLQIVSDALSHIVADAPKLAWLKARQDYILGASRLAQKSVAAQQSIVIGDESILQNMVAVFLTRQSGKDLAPALADFARTCPKPDVVVSFRAPPAVLWQRLQSRPQGMPAVFRETPKDTYIAAAERIDAGIQSTRLAFEMGGAVWHEVTPQDDFASILARIS